MKRLILSLAMMAIMAVGTERAFAGPAPLDTKESKAVVQPAPPPECRWTGFYIGNHGGYVWADDASLLELNQSDPPFEFNRDGLIGGGQLGYNFQLGSWFVVGVEGTFSAGDIDDPTRIDKGGGDSDAGHLENNWLATAGARVGVSFCKNRLLAYLKGGAAFTDYDFNTREIGDNGKFHADDDEVLGLIGTGLEYALNCHWSVRIEYNHLFAGDQNVTGIEDDGGVRQKRTFHFDEGDWDIVHLGLNFKF